AALHDDEFAREVRQVWYELHGGCPGTHDCYASTFQVDLVPPPRGVHERPVGCICLESLDSGDLRDLRFAQTTRGEDQHSRLVLARWAGAPPDLPGRIP